MKHTLDVLQPQRPRTPPDVSIAKFTVKNYSKKVRKTTLRNRPSSDLANNKNGNTVLNDDIVTIVNSDVDEDHYKMYRVVSEKDKSTSGWIYARNLEEFQS